MTSKKKEGRRGSFGIRDFFVIFFALFFRLDLILANHTMTAVNEVVVDEVDK